MNAIKDAAEMVGSALDGVEDVRYYRDLGANVDPPATLLGPPQLKWEAYCSDPTSAQFMVYLVVPAKDRAIEQLWDLVPKVAEALDESDAVVRRADPGTFNAGGSDLPSYELTVEVAV